MNKFEFKNPTKIIFGKNEIAKLSSEIPKDAKILMLYGGGSIKSNGVYQQVKEALKDYNLIEFAGIESNPEFSILLKALDIIKENNIDFLLAVGGGSVIDATKFLAAAALYSAEDKWELLKSMKPVRKALTFASVLTMPATGSEMNSGAVISRRETKEKLGLGGPALFPLFSILDPLVISSIPPRQIANGLVDAFSHVLEQYMTYPVNALLTDRFAEGILQTLVELSATIVENPADENAAANFMFACTMALNGLIELGVPSDWAVHAMGHELTALYGIDHARTLAIITPSHFRYNFEAKKLKLAQYAERVWNVSEGSLEEKAMAGIEKTELFFNSLGVDTKLSQYTDKYEGTAEFIAQRFTERGWKGIGENRSLTPEDVKKIVTMAY